MRALVRLLEFAGADPSIRSVPLLTVEKGSESGGKRSARLKRTLALRCTHTHRNSKGLTPLALAREKGEHFKGAVAVLEVRVWCCAVSQADNQAGGGDGLLCDCGRADGCERG